jgi:Glycosyltransferase family 87
LKPGRTIILVVALLLALSLVSFAIALPEITRADSGCCAPGSGTLAKDFSAYYVAAWRLFHDPANVYTKGSVPDGGPQVLPQPQEYKYLPSFLILAAPLLLLPYQTALLAFDLFQLLLLPLLALLLYRIMKGRGLVAISLVEVAVLVAPSPFPGWGFSAAYYWQWGEGQAKVLVTFLLVLALYLAKHGRPRLAGVACALAAFDPRFLVLAVPLLASYSRGKWTQLAAVFAVVFAVLNLPLLSSGVSGGMVQMLESGGALTLPFPYSWIPLVAVLSLTVVDWRFIRGSFSPLQEHSMGAGPSLRLAPGGDPDPSFPEFRDEEAHVFS